MHKLIFNSWHNFAEVSALGGVHTPDYGSFWERPLVDVSAPGNVTDLDRYGCRSVADASVRGNVTIRLDLPCTSVTDYSALGREPNRVNQ